MEFQSLTETERLFHTALDQFPGAFNIYDAGRRLVAEASRVSGLRFDQLIGFRDEELIPREVCDQYIPFLEKTYETKQQRPGNCSKRSTG